MSRRHARQLGASKSNAAFKTGGFTGTPTVLLDGKNIYQDQTMTPAKLKQMVQEADKAVEAQAA